MMRGGLDRISVLFLGLALLAFILFVTSYWWHGEWVVRRFPTHNIRLLSNHGGLALQRIDPPEKDGTRRVYPRIVGVPYPAIVLVLLKLEGDSPSAERTPGLRTSVARASAT